MIGRGSSQPSEPGRGFVVVAPSPPPVHGVAMMTGPLLDALSACGHLRAHVDSRDSRRRPTLEKAELGKALLTGKVIAETALRLVQHPGAGLYVPISQAPLALARDIILLLIARALRRKRVIHLHGGALACVLEERPILRRLVRLAAKGDTEGWALTNGLRSQFADVVSIERTAVLANCVADPGPAERVRVGRQPLRVVLISNLQIGKGHGLLLDALANLDLRKDALEVRLGGRGSAEATLDIASRVHALSAQGWNITFVGGVNPSERWQLLEWADVFVMPTTYRFEGQPLAIIEAMAASCAVISTPHGGIPETFSDEVEGRIVAADPDAVAAVLRELAEDPASVVRYKLRGRRRYEADYSPAVYQRRLRQLVEPEAG